MPSDEQPPLPTDRPGPPTEVPGSPGPALRKPTDPGDEIATRAPDLSTPADVPHPLLLTAGSKPFPDYELVSLCGRGSFGEVWRAIGPGGVLLALKFIRLEGRVGDSELRALNLIRTIRHPHLTGVQAVWQRDGMLVLAMELADGTLQERLDASLQQGLPGIPAEELHEYFREAAKGIDHLTIIGIAHRDIKPQNLLLFGGGVKVADFGLAKLIEHARATSSGSMTPAYAAPEFFDGQMSNRSDQYALAVSYCQLIGGRLPFSGTVAQLMAGHVKGEPDLSMVPEGERPIVRRALAKKPDDRYPDCRAFVRALTEHASVRPARSRRSWSWDTLLVLMGALLPMIAVLLWVLNRGPDPLTRLHESEIKREVEGLLADPPVAIRELPANAQFVKELPAPDHSGFVVLGDDRVVDMRGWKLVPPEQTAELYSAITLTTRVRLKKIAPVSEYRFVTRTSGLDLFTSAPGPYPYQVLVHKGEIFVGQDRMKSRQAVVDVSSVPVGSELHLHSVTTFWNSMQTEPEQWFGIIGRGRSFKISQLLLFPEGKPFTSYELKVSENDRTPPVAFTGPRFVVVGPGNSWLYWEVPSPEDGRVYRLHWKW
jgi:serine/threonine protein kinase